MLWEERRCCFTGHRPDKLPWGAEEDAPGCLRLKECLEAEILRLFRGGVTEFFTGMAMGVDLWAAEILIGLRQQYRELRVLAVVPCRRQAEDWPPAWQRRYLDVLRRADEVIYLQDGFTEDCMVRRDRYMVDHCGHVIAVYGGLPGGTRYTLSYAQRQGRDITVLDPANFADLGRRKT